MFNIYHGSADKNLDFTNIESVDRIWKDSNTLNDVVIETKKPIYFWAEDISKSYIDKPYNLARNSALTAAIIKGQLDKIYIHKLSIAKNDFNKYFKADPLHSDKGAVFIDSDILYSKFYSKIKTEEIVINLNTTQAALMINFIDTTSINKELIPKKIIDEYNRINNDMDHDYFPMIKPIVDFMNGL